MQEQETYTLPPQRGLMLVLSSPSGAGKTTLTRALLARNPDWQLSISATTRAPRPGEEDGTHYYFTSQAMFDAMIKNNELLEYATVFKQSYGTPRAPVEAALQAGQVTLFDIDWQGMQQLKLTMRHDMASVFILPPSMPELRRRLEGRSTDSPDTIDYRMQKAQSEISHWAEYDYVLINQDIEACVAAVESIVIAERKRRTRQPHLTGFVRDLLSADS